MKGNMKRRDILKMSGLLALGASFTKLLFGQAEESVPLYLSEICLLINLIG